MTSRRIWTVCVRSDVPVPPMVASFTSRNLAEAFKEKVESQLERLEVDWMTVTIDSGELNSGDEIIEMIEDRFGEDDEGADSQMQ